MSQMPVWIYNDSIEVALILLNHTDVDLCVTRAAQFLTRLVQFVVSLASGIESPTLTLGETARKQVERTGDGIKMVLPSRTESKYPAGMTASSE